MTSKNSKEKTYRVAMAELHSQFYVVKAKNADQATERAYNFDEDQDWAIETWDEGVETQDHAFTEEDRE